MHNNLSSQDISETHPEKSNSSKSKQKALERIKQATKEERPG